VIELTEQDLAEAVAIAAAVRLGQQHQQVEPRHVVAVVEWGARLEQEVMATAPYLDRFDRAEVDRQMGRPS
jgi:hypothetical protein